MKEDVPFLYKVVIIFMKRYWVNKSNILCYKTIVRNKHE